MKKILIMLLTAATLIDCSKVGNGFKFRIRDNEVSWTNGTVMFRTDMDSKGKRDDNTGFQAFLKTERGRTIKMPGTDILGYGASCPMGATALYKNRDGYSMAEVLTRTDDRMVIHLHHDPWEMFDEEISFDKQITLFRDSPIMSVIDYYEGIFELLNVAAGLNTTDADTVKELEKGYAIEYSNGVTAILIMPDMEKKSNKPLMNSVFVTKGVTSNEPLRYYIGLSDKGVDYLLEELDKIL
jgi:hypothetical protein